MLRVPADEAEDRERHTHHRMRGKAKRGSECGRDEDTSDVSEDGFDCVGQLVHFVLLLLQGWALNNGVFFARLLFMRVVRSFGLFDGDSEFEVPDLNEATHAAANISHIRKAEVMPGAKLANYRERM